MASVTREQVISIMNSAGLDTDISSLDPSKSLSKQGLDSLDMINALFALQEALNIKISDDEMNSGGWDTIDNIVASLNTKLQ